jgi:hypothetical protein
MIRIEKVEVFNLEGAIRGARNPMNSWAKSDSGYGCRLNRETDCVRWDIFEDGDITMCRDCTWCEPLCWKDETFKKREYIIGENDLNLLKRLVAAGSDERKFMRQILVSFDITAPLYWWKEYDTYKVATTANSTSTMHKIHAKPFEVSDFSVERMSGEAGKQLIGSIIGYLEHNRKLFNETGDKKYWENIIQILPSSYNQTRTLTLNYEVLRNIYHAREHHKLKEWRELCEEIKKMPYSELITMKAKVAK